MRMCFILALMVLCGCTTYITATKHPEVASPVYAYTEGGEAYVVDYRITSGGWTVKASSPVWAAESLNGLSVTIETNGTVACQLTDYNRDVSTNTVAIVSDSTDIIAKLAAIIKQ